MWRPENRLDESKLARDFSNGLISKDWGLYWNFQVEEKDMDAIFDKIDNIEFMVWTTERRDEQTIAWIQTKLPTYMPKVQLYFKDALYTRATFGDEEFNAWFMRKNKDRARIRGANSSRYPSGETPSRLVIEEICWEAVKQEGLDAEIEITLQNFEYDPFIDPLSDEDE